LTDLAPASDDEVGLSSGAATDLGVDAGDSITLMDRDFTVSTVGDDLWYSHAPVIAVTPDVWSEISQRTGGTGEATLLAVSGAPDWDGVAAQTETTAQTPLSSLTALEAFR